MKTQELEKVAVALYTINKEAKKLRDKANKIEQEIEEEVDLYGYGDEFPYWRKIKWVLQNIEEEVYELRRNSRLEHYLEDAEEELEKFEKDADPENKNDLEKLRELEHNIDEIKIRIEIENEEIAELEEKMNNFNKKIDKVDEIRDKIDDLYQLKNKALYKIVSLLELSPVTYHQTGTSYYTQKICVHRDEDGEEYENYTEATNYYRPLYSFAGLSFHGKSFKKDELPENIDVDEIEELGEISAENKLEGKEKMNVKEAISFLEKLLKRTEKNE